MQHGQQGDKVTKIQSKGIGDERSTLSHCNFVALSPQRTYAEVLVLQQQLVEERQRSEGEDALILCEHPPVYTLGVGASVEDLRGVRDVPVYRVGRGGGVTWHGPGQLIGYPILRLRDWGWRVSDYLCVLERALIATVRAFDVDAHCEGPTRGVYVEDRKLASIGIQVSRGVVWHGFALNVSCDLAPFTRIVPCRQLDTQMTSLAQELGKPLAVSQVQREFLHQWNNLAAGPTSSAAGLGGCSFAGRSSVVAGAAPGLAPVLRPRIRPALRAGEAPPEFPPPHPATLSDGSEWAGCVVGQFRFPLALRLASWARSGCAQVAASRGRACSANAPPRAAAVKYS